MLLTMDEKDALATKVQAEVDRLAPRFEDIDPAVFDQPVHDGGWTFRELLSHMLFWQQECLWAFRSTMEGTYERRDYSDTNKVNAMAVDRLKDVSGPEVARLLVSTLREIAETISQVDDDLWTAKPRLAAWVNGTVIEHHEDHRPDLDRALNGM